MKEAFRFQDGQLAYTVEDLIKQCEKSPQAGIYYLMREDFEKWLDYLGKSDLAQRAREARQASLSDEERLHQFLESCKSPNLQNEKPKKDSKPSPDFNLLSDGLKAIENILFGKGK